MRLINVHSLELKEFIGKPPPYAILSHRWTDDEISYKDFVKGREKQSRGYRKIEGFCSYIQLNKMARREQLHWAWVDTCCIDKRSSAELSEAINSMGKLYGKSTVCVTYLEDAAPLADSGETIFAEFERSEWFDRGWTLQELLMPTKVVFCTRSWETIGTKRDKLLLDRIVKRTSIHEDYLLSIEDVQNATIAKRISWVSERTTTREEDWVYCLLGLLDVNMPLLYGEGVTKAFRRLQVELINQSVDDSIFAWRANWRLHKAEQGEYQIPLAHSPANFRGCQHIDPRGLPAARQPYFITNKGVSFTGEAVCSKVALECMFSNKDFRDTDNTKLRNRNERIDNLYLIPLECKDSSVAEDETRYELSRCVIVFWEFRNGELIRISGDKYGSTIADFETWWNQGERVERQFFWIWKA